MTFQELETNYTKAATAHAEAWGETNPHVIRIIKSVMMHRDGVLSGGGFVEAVVNNDLRQAVGRADATCYGALKVIVAANIHCYVENYIS